MESMTKMAGSGGTDASRCHTLLCVLPVTHSLITAKQRFTSFPLHSVCVSV